LLRIYYHSFGQDGILKDRQVYLLLRQSGKIRIYASVFLGYSQADDRIVAICRVFNTQRQKTYKTQE